MLCTSLVRNCLAATWTVQSEQSRKNTDPLHGPEASSVCVCVGGDGGLIDARQANAEGGSSHQDKAGGCPTEEDVAVFAVVHLYLCGVVQNIYIAVVEVHDDKTLAAFDGNYDIRGRQIPSWRQVKAIRGL